MSNPKISVIITYYNEENNLHKFISDLVNQSFSDIEIICLNNGSKDNSESIIKKFAVVDERIKLISIPDNDKIETVRKIALGIASGELVCFVDVKESLPIDYIHNLFLDLVSDNAMVIESNHLYRRAFLENSKDINQVIKEKMIDVFEHSCKSLENQKQDIRIELDDFYQKNKDYINDKTYDIYSMFNSFTEKFKSQENYISTVFETAKKDLLKQNEESYKKFYYELNEMSANLNGRIDEKGCDINKAFAEITKNYNYTEKIIDEKFKKAVEFNDNKKLEETFKNKFSELEKDISATYSGLKRLLDNNIASLNAKLNNGSNNFIELNDKNLVSVSELQKAISANVDKMYDKINGISSMFYEELAKVYTEFSQRQAQKDIENKAMFEKMLNEMKEEIKKDFNNKIQTIEKKDL